MHSSLDLGNLNWIQFPQSLKSFLKVTLSSHLYVWHCNNSLQLLKSEKGCHTLIKQPYTRRFVTYSSLIDSCINYQWVLLMSKQKVMYSLMCKFMIWYHVHSVDSAASTYKQLFNLNSRSRTTWSILHSNNGVNPRLQCDWWNQIYDPTLIS